MTDGTTAWSHEPPAYDCPFCRLQRGVFNDLNRAEDVVAVTDLAYARISPKWWSVNTGAALVIPRAHHENLYDLPSRVLQRIALTAKQVALAMKEAWAPDGVSTRQHNEPAGNQHVWHYHLHVFPRFEEDLLYRQLRHAVAPEVRAAKARELAAVLDMGPTRI